MGVSHSKKGCFGIRVLKDKAVIITGGDSGIGSAIAVLSAGEGADLITFCFGKDEEAELTKEKLKSVVEMLALFTNGEVYNRGHYNPMFN